MVIVGRGGGGGKLTIHVDTNIVKRLTLTSKRSFSNKTKIYEVSFTLACFKTFKISPCTRRATFHMEIIIDLQDGEPTYN